MQAMQAGIPDQRVQEGATSDQRIKEEPHDQRGQVEVEEVGPARSRAPETSATRPEELPELEEEYWTRLAAMKTQFESFASSYIKTLDACVHHRQL